MLGEMKKLQALSIGALRNVERQGPLDGKPSGTLRYLTLERLLGLQMFEELGICTAFEDIEARPTVDWALLRAPSLKIPSCRDRGCPCLATARRLVHHLIGIGDSDARGRPGRKEQRAACTTGRAGGAGQSWTHSARSAPRKVAAASRRRRRAGETADGITGIHEWLFAETDGGVRVTTNESSAGDPVRVDVAGMHAQSTDRSWSGSTTSRQAAEDNG